MRMVMEGCFYVQMGGIWVPFYFLLLFDIFNLEFLIYASCIIYYAREVEVLLLDEKLNKRYSSVAPYLYYEYLKYHILVFKNMK